MVEGVEVEVVVVVVVEGEGLPVTWITSPTTMIARPSPPRIGHRRGRRGLGSGPPSTE
jgi:hypothetical protein